MSTIINDGKYDFNSSCINLKENKFPIYAHPNELLYEHMQKTYAVFDELSDKRILTSFYSFFMKKVI